MVVSAVWWRLEQAGWMEVERRERTVAVWGLGEVARTVSVVWRQVAEACRRLLLQRRPRSS
jgi:hypothetical protein